MNQFDRIFALHRLLAGRRVARSLDDLRQELSCSEASVKRAIRELRDVLQAPLIYDREQNGYRYDADAAYELPGLWFSADELSALLVLQEVAEQQPLGFLAETLRPLRARIEQMLSRAGVGMPEWRTRLRLLRMAARPTGEMFMPVAAALACQQRLSIDYHGRKADTMRRRIVSPQRLVLYRDNWYLDAWCHAQEGLRTFALDRIIAAEALGAPSQAIASSELDEVLATSYGIFAGKPTAVARLAFSPYAARWVAAEQWHPDQRDEHYPDGGLIRELPYRHAEELLMDIFRHGPEVEVLAPAELRDALVARLDAARARYARPSGRKPVREAAERRVRF